MTAFFIAVEGIDGSGKSYQAAQIAVGLRERGRRVFECADSKCGVWGAAARDWIAQQPDALAGAREAAARNGYPISAASTDEEYVLACFVLSREELSHQIRDALADGMDVVCDRWEPSTWAYQIASGVPVSTVLRWTRKHPPVVQPDLTLWLRLPVPEALRRVHAAASAGGRIPCTRFETPAFLDEVASCYEGMPGLVPIDAGQPVEAVTAEALAYVTHLLRWPPTGLPRCSLRRTSRPRRAHMRELDLPRARRTYPRVPARLPEHRRDL